MFLKKGRLLPLMCLGLIFLTLSGAFAQSDSPPLTFDFQNVDRNPVLEFGTTGEWDSVSVRFPQIIVHDEIYYLFYGTFQTMTAPVAIGFAQSDDGINWTKFDGNPVLEGSGGGFDAFGVTRPVVTVESDGTWVLYYSGIPESNNVFGTAIGRATAPSPEGPWTRDSEPVLEIGGGGAWDTPFLFPDSVVHDGDQYVMYYSSGFQAGRATSDDGIHWTKYNDPDTSGRFADSDPVLTTGSASDWDSRLAWGGSVHLTPDGWEMFYYGGTDLRGGSNIKIGYAQSEDGIMWTKYPEPIIGFDDLQAFFPSVLVNNDDSYSVYYAVTSGAASTVFYLSIGTITRGEP